MIYFAAFAAIAVFLGAFQLLRVVPVASDAAGVAQEAMRSVRDSSLSDEEKEVLMQRASLKLLGGFVSLSVRGALALAFSAFPLFAMQWMGLTRVDDVVSLLSTWQAILATTVVITAGYWLHAKAKSTPGQRDQLHSDSSATIESAERPEPTSLEDNYSSLDRMIHGLAFSGRAFQLTAADMESAFFSARFRNVRATSPVFVTSLPRAGTTLMLEVLHHVPALSTHLYRDMPFVFAPMLWDRWSGRFRKNAELAERAHGDGMLVGFDSPEAFEEILWRMFFPKKFEADRILLWKDSENAEEFQEFFLDHMKKIVALRAGPRSTGEPKEETQDVAGRYLSKNNANVARIGLIKRLFPGSTVLVPFRHPVDQATSLLRQHEKFLKVHSAEVFSKRYMHDIGHLEFGELHRPIAFDGMAEVIARYEPVSLEYWVGYWVAAFEQILSRPDLSTFVSYERFCGDQAASIQALSDGLDLVPSDFGGMPDDLLRSPRSYRSLSDVSDPQLARRAGEIHERLLSLSIL